MADTVRALGEVVGEVLRRMARELLARKAGGHLVEANLDRLDLRLPLVLKGSEATPEAFAQELVSRLDRLLDEEIERAASFRPGRAFCHRCGSAACDHSLPPSPRHVFEGYSPTGTPSWKDFAQYCLELRHPDVDRLYADPPVFLTQVQTGAELRKRLLAAFRASSSELVGQLVAGFFPLRIRRDEGRGVLALTFQVAASRSPGGRLRLGLNILGTDTDGVQAGRVWERYGDVPWRRSVRWAQSALSSVRERRSRAAGAGSPETEVDRRVEGILGGLARRLERDLRARKRRTRHAEARHTTGDRPTRMALDDVRGAGSEGVLVDEKSGTLVVLGGRGRTHFFTAEGRHVSSVRYTREAIERKRKLGFWREASAGEATTLRDRLLESG